MKQKFKESFSLLRDNFVLFSALILTVWLPGNLVINYYDHSVYFGHDDRSVFRLTNTINTFLGPICVGALLYALGKIKIGEKVTYLQAMGVGIRKWPTIFIGNVLVGVLTLFCLFLLIIPGLIVFVKYQFVESAIIIEGVKATQAMKRSWKLTSRKAMKFLGIWALFIIGYLVLVFIKSLFVELIDTSNNIIINSLLDCILNLGYIPIQILMFLYYWEAREEETVENFPVELPE